MVPEFRKLRKADIYQFSKWGRHEDPRFYQYNFPFDTKEEFDDWFRTKQKWIRRKVYGLFLDAHPVAFITLKNINWFKRSAELGIGVDPNYLGKGLGTVALNKYLEYIFNSFPIETMFLRVAVFNERARRSYEKVGFREVQRCVKPFEEQGYKDLILQDYQDQFQMIQGELCTMFIIMSIRKKDFMQLKRTE
ncbi:GNAT family N-acetyltransferase [Fusibacter ferrireducens]|uniref:GNAT family N-acetyltransferase n=1 Tax=Fusibacter ferrireducens TaxID=2785058 RepID=A0ABR9ZYE1_9FIRM|nr:GNAT family protein [Fusibacter ferrireducens]MBF4695487.1 GNAT family N-acetyltransferase [Fusibacter ferrireducens]